MLEELIQDILTMHNDARRYAPGIQRLPLTWDNELEAAAERYANLLAGRGGTSPHDPQEASNFGQGENVYWDARTFSDSELYHGAISYWTNENTRYQGQNMNLKELGKFGHYTQIIWPSTTRVGMSSAKTKSGATYIVARYAKRGNVIGQSAYGMTCETGIFPALSSEVGNEGLGISTPSPSRPYEKLREDPTLVHHHPSHQHTKEDSGTSILGSHGNVSDLRSYKPTIKVGDAAARERTGSSNVRSCRPVTRDKFQAQTTTITTTTTSPANAGKYEISVDQLEITNRNRVRDIKSFIRDIEEPIRRFSPWKLFGKKKKRSLVNSIEERDIPKGSS